MSDYRPHVEVEGQQTLIPKLRATVPHSGQRAKVYEALSHPMTAHDIAGIVGSYPNCVARRLRDLEDDGLVRRVGTVDGGQGRKRTVWEAR